MQKKYIKIKEKEIPVIIREYKQSRNIKMYFKEDKLNISKPKIVNMRKIEKMIKGNENQIYEQYKKIISKENKKMKHWYTGEKILYKGEEYTIIIENNKNKRISIEIKEAEKQIKITIPEEISEEEKKMNIDKTIKKLFKINTNAEIENRLPYWSKKMNIQYKSYKVGDATSKFGSCIPSKKIMHFSNRLIMLPERMVDAIIVHELSHIIYPNHSKEFYNLIKKYINDYDEIDKWLKINSYQILI